MTQPNLDQLVNQDAQAKLNDIITNYDTSGTTSNDQMNTLLSQMSGTNSDGMNQMFQNMQSLLTCDSDCQKRKKIDELRNNWKNQEKQQQLAPNAVENAEKEYYIFAEGEQGYEQMLLKKYTKQSSKENASSNKSHHNLIKELHKLVDNYKTDTATLNHLKELSKMKLLEHNKLESAIDKDISIVQTNDRKVVYEDWAKGWLGTVQSMLFWVYVILAAILLWKGTFYSRAEYKTIKGWIQPIIFIILPFILPYIADLIIALYGYIIWFSKNNSQKNVYSNL